MKIVWFCIPAYGHTNPTIEVVREVVKRGHEIRYYSFEEFREKIEDTGAAFVSIDSYLPPLDEKSQDRLKRVSTTEMSVQSFETTARLDPVLAKELAEFQPSGVVSDSACFWGKLTAIKQNLPLICSTTTFAFNQYSSKYLRYSLSELADMALGLPRMNTAIRKLKPLGYQVRSALEIVQNSNDTNTIVYTSARFQPFSETFDSQHYRFVGPSVKDAPVTRQEGQRPLVYVSLGTVINERPDFYRCCVEAARGEPFDLLISCGKVFDPAALGELPENVRVEHYVDQMEVLAGANLFITHCGMNSASEGLYMAVPELLYPQTGEQQAVARRVCEMGAGRMLTKKEAQSPDGIRTAIRLALMDEELKKAALAMREDFRSCSGFKGAADFVEEVFG